MFKVSSDLVRSAYIGGKLKSIIDDKNLVISDIAVKIWTSQPALSRNLNWKTWWSDNFFKKVWKAIWLSDKEIQEIFKKADQEEYKYKYWVEIIPDWDINTLEWLDFDNNELAKVLMKREFWKDATEEDIKEIMNFIKFKAGK